MNKLCYIETFTKKLFIGIPNDNSYAGLSGLYLVPKSFYSLFNDAIDIKSFKSKFKRLQCNLIYFDKSSDFIELKDNPEIADLYRQYQNWFKKVIKHE